MQFLSMGITMKWFFSFFVVNNFRKIQISSALHITHYQLQCNFLFLIPPFKFSAVFFVWGTSITTIDFPHVEILLISVITQLERSFEVQFPDNILDVVIDASSRHRQGNMQPACIVSYVLKEKSCCFAFIRTVY